MSGGGGRQAAGIQPCGGTARLKSCTPERGAALEFRSVMNDQQYWERHARRYDASMRLLLGKPVAPMLELSKDAVRHASRVLEVAAGTGLVTRAIAGSVASLVATDYAAAMVAILEERVRELRLTNVICEQADLYRLPYPKGQFDAVVAANVLHLVPDLPEAVLALRRVLRPGGCLVAPTFCHGETALSNVISRALSWTGFPSQRRFTSGTLKAELAAAGLRIGRIQVLNGPIPITYVDGAFT
jgi:phosphatidylethanolamine/phosphatidyl-N-methylethanolamine N-methyltransferase